MRTQILTIGDSVTEMFGATSMSRGWPSVLSRLLGGRGDGSEWLKPMYGHSTMPWPVSRTGSVTEIYGRAIGREEVTLAGSGATAGTVTWTFVGTSCEVMYSIGSLAGVMRVAIDGGAGVLVDTASSVSTGTIGSWRSPMLTRGTHHVTVSRDDSSATDRMVYLHGVATYDGDDRDGLRVINGGRSGARSYQWVDQYSGARRSQWLGVDAQRLWGIDCALITLGINDSRDDPPVTKSDYKANLETLISDLRTYGFCGEVVLVTLYLTAAGNGDVAARADYATACDEIASTDPQITHVDLRTKMPRVGSWEAVARGLYVDQLHPTDVGHALVAQLVAAHMNEHRVLSQRPADYSRDDTTRTGITLSNGTALLPNRGDAVAYPMLDLIGPHDAITLEDGSASTTIGATAAGSIRTVDLRNGLVWQGQTRVPGALSGGLPSVPPGGTAWTVSGLGSGLARARRFEAWT